MIGTGQDKPSMIYWKTRTGIVLNSVLDPAISEVAEKYDVHTRTSNHVVLRHWIPFGIVGWSLSPDGPWEPLIKLPESWGLK